MLQVCNSSRKMDAKNQSMIEKDLCLIGKTHSSTTCYSSNIWLRFSNTGLFGFLWRLQKLNRLFDWVFEELGCLFWNRYLAECFGYWEILIIFEDLVCKKHTYSLHLMKTWNSYQKPMSLISTLKSFIQCNLSLSFCISAFVLGVLIV